VAIGAREFGELISVRRVILVTSDASRTKPKKCACQHPMLLFKTANCRVKNVRWPVTGRTKSFSMASNEIEAGLQMIEGRCVKPYGFKFRSKMLLVALCTILANEIKMETHLITQACTKGFVARKALVVLDSLFPKLMARGALGNTR